MKDASGLIVLVLWCCSLPEVNDKSKLWARPVNDVIMNKVAAAWLMNGIRDQQLNVLLFGRLNIITTVHLLQLIPNGKFWYY